MSRWRGSTIPPRSTDRAKAQLFVRDRQTDQRTEIPADQWEFASARIDPAAAEGHEVRDRRDLRAVLRGDAIEGRRHRLCGDPRRGVVPAPREGRRQGRGQSAQRARHPPCAGVRRLAGRPLPAPLCRTRHEQGPAPAARCSTASIRTPPAPARCSPITRFAEPDRTATQHEDHDYPENWFPFCDRADHRSARSARPARCCAATAPIR